MAISETEELRRRIARLEKTQRRLIEALRQLPRLEHDDAKERLDRILLLLEKRLEGIDR